MSCGIIVIDSIGGFCPTQGEGTIDGVPFYFRARHGAWGMGVGKDPVGVAMGMVEGFLREGDDPTSGYMEEAEVERIIRECAAEYLSELRKEQG